MGHYVPGTFIKIVAEDQIDEYDVGKFCLYINPEITQHLLNKGFKGEVVPVI